MNLMMMWILDLLCQVMFPKKSKTPNNKYNHKCRVEEYVMQGIEYLSIANDNEDFAETENVTNMNMYDGGNDEFTIESEPPFSHCH